MEILDLDTHAEPYVTISDIAAYWKVNRSTIYRDIAKGALLPHFLPSGKMRISIQAAREYGKPEE
jgi:predicted DNA-binding transcriptional regulator YafY|tara:strand:- start:2463 stop:2657 length:195 start_codon:yes stop_codon:yes gene_type:complete